MHNRFALILIAIVLFGAVGYCQDVCFTYVRVASVDQINQEIVPILQQIAGEEVPIDNLIGEVEGQFPFIGEGGFARNLPTGIFYIYGRGLSQEQMAAFAFPVNDGYGSLDVFDEQGGEKVPGYPNARLVNGMYFVRTDNYLMFGGSKLVLKLATTQLWATFESDESLASIHYDGNELNAKYPRAVKEVLDKIKREQPGPGPGAGKAEMEGYEIGQNLALSAFESISKGVSTIALHRNGDAVELRLDLQADRQFNVNAGSAKKLPASSIIDFYFTNTDGMQEAIAALIKAVENEQPKSAKGKALFPRFLKDFKEFCESFKSFSAGFESEGPAIYVVKENGRPVNSDVDLVRNMVRCGNQIEKAEGGSDTVQISELPARGGMDKPGLRISLGSDGYLFFFQKDRYSYLVFSESATPYDLFGKLVATPQARFPQSRLIDCTLKLKKLVEMAGEVPEEIQPLVSRIGDDAQIRFTVDAQGDRLGGLISIPVSMFTEDGEEEE